jgi:hypothetical protein
MCTLVALPFVAAPTSAGAQQRDTAQQTQRDTTPGRRGPERPRQAIATRDSLKPPISPRRAFFYSALLPGYAQTVLDRPLAGALFMTAEAVGIALANKAAYDLRFARAHARDSIVVSYTVDASGKATPVYARNRYAGSRVKARKTHLEDWYAFLAFNHLLAGAEAFVSANLWDLPGRVSINADRDGLGFAVSIPW